MKKAKQHKKATPADVSKPKKVQSTFIHPLFLLGGILALTLLVYAGSLKNELLTFDDNDYFQNYPEIINLSWESVGKYFSNYYLIMYQPLPVLTFAINYNLSGLDPFPLHLVNLLLHLVCVALVYRFINELIQKPVVALMVALLFAIHPMNVEAVAWISARSSTMYTMFYLAGLFAYLKWIKEGRTQLIIAAGIFFILSLFSKVQAVTFPVVLLLLDYFNNRNLLSRKVIIEKIPFFLLSITFGIIALLDTDTQKNLTEGMLIDYNPLDMFFLATYSFSFYLTKLILPFNLCAIYVYPPKTDGMLPTIYYISSLLIGVMGYLLYRFRKNRNVVLCAGLFLITIAINIQIIPSRLFIVTDRYAYFPFIGLFLLPFLAIENYKNLQPGKYTKQLPYMIGCYVLVVIMFIIATEKRSRIWETDIPFLTDIIDKNPQVKYIYRAYGNRGFIHKKNNQMNEALADFTESIKLNPDDARGFYNRGMVHVAQNNIKPALSDMNEAIKLDSTQAVLYGMRGQLRLMLSDTTGSIIDSKKCIELDSANFDAYNTLATINFAQGNYSECESNLSMAINYNPKFSIAIKNRGLLYYRMGRRQEACQDLMSASYMNNEEAKALYSQYCK